MYYYVNKLRQNVGLETWIWRQIVTSQTTHTKYKWPPYDPEPTSPHENFLRTPLQLVTPYKNKRTLSACTIFTQIAQPGTTPGQLGLIARVTLSDTEYNCWRPAALKFPVALFLAGIIVALWLPWRNNNWKVPIRTHPLFRNRRHRTMTTPVSPLRARLIHMNQSYWTIYRFFENILEWELSIGLEFKSNVLRKSIASQKHWVWCELYFFKYLITEGDSGCNGWSREKFEQTKSRERLLRTIFFYSGHLQHERERSDMKRRYMRISSNEWWIVQ